MTSVYFQRKNQDETIDLFLEFTTEDAEMAEEYCDIRNGNLALAGIPSSIACFYTS